MTVIAACGICRRSREASASPAAPAPAMTIRAFAEDVAALTLESAIPFTAANAAPVKRNRLLFITRLLFLDDGSRVWGKLASHPIDDLLRGHRAGRASQLIAVRKKDERGDAANTKPGGDFLMLVRVQLDEPQVGLQHPVGSFKRGRHHPARAAPRRPYVHQHRHGTAAGLLIKHDRIDFNGVAVKQRCLTRTAPGLAGVTLCHHPAYRGALRANYGANGFHCVWRLTRVCPPCYARGDDPH